MPREFRIWLWPIAFLVVAPTGCMWTTSVSDPRGSVPGHAAEDWVNKGAALAESGQFQQAIECCDRAIALNPDYAEAWSNKSAALLDLGQYQEALECSNRAIGLKPDYADAWGNKGIALCGLSNSLRSGGRACRMVDPILTTPMERTIPRSYE